MKQQFKAVIFDLDGTLADTLADLAACGNECAALVSGAPIEVDKYRYIIGDGLGMLAERVLGANDPGRIATFCEAFKARLPEYQLRTTRLYLGVRELLASLAARGVRTAVFTNKPQPLAELLLAHLLADHRFAVIAGQVPERPRKPDPAGVFAICAALRLPITAVLYVGDSAVDMETGRRAGVATAGVLWGFRSARELVQAGAQFLAASPCDLQGCLGGLAPLEYLATDRLVIRPAVVDDLPHFEDFWTDAEANCIDHGTPDAGAWQGTRVDELHRLLKKRPSRSIWTVLLPPTLEVVGYLRLRRYSFLSARGTIAIRFGRPWWNRGYATEAMRAWCGHLATRRRLRVLDLSVLAENAPAMRVYAKTGFSVVATRTRSGRPWCTLEWHARP